MDNPFGGDTIKSMVLFALLVIIAVALAMFLTGWFVGKVMYNETDEDNNQPTKSSIQSEAPRQVAGRTDDFYSHWQ